MGCTKYYINFWFASYAGIIRIRFSGSKSVRISSQPTRQLPLRIQLFSGIFPAIII